jgi:hypothetical protein
MNLNFRNFRIASKPGQTVAIRLAWAAGIVLLTFMSALPRLHAQSGGDSSADFKRLVADLSAARLNGAEESETQQEKPLVFLDSIASTFLNGSATPDLAAGNQRLASLASQAQPASGASTWSTAGIGENFRLLKLGGTPAVYAMVVNFGLSGPAAVRIYAATNGRFALASRIDHFVQKDFFDSDIELIPVSKDEPVFVTVSGRTDDLSTGIFSAWRFDGHRVVSLWSSDLLQQSNYEADADGFHLTYCGQVDEDHPSQCLKMTRDVYLFQANEWKRVGTADLSPAKPSSK